MRTVVTVLLLTLAAGCGQAAAGTGSGGPDLGVTSSPPAGSGGGAPSRLGGATLVTPKPGAGPTAPVHPVGLRAGTGSAGAWALVTWYGGIEPCSVLRPVSVRRVGWTIRLRLREGSDAPAGSACPELAMKKVVRVSLGVLGPGAYTVVAGRRRTTLTV
jgi:hypothetical protein